MMSLRYGTIPVVRETGGLKDSVAPYNEYEKTGTGFSFAHYSADEMMSVIDYAIKIYNDEEQWDVIVENAMNEKLDWENSANKYMEVFNKLVD